MGGRVTMKKDVRRPANDFRATEFVVRPRKPYDDTRPIIAVARGMVWVESTGEVHAIDSLAELLLVTEPSILACENAPALLVELDAKFANFPGWHWRVTPIVKRKYRPHTGQRKPTESVNVIVNYLGWRYPKGESGSRFTTHYHYPIDTMTFLGGSIGKALPDHSDPLHAVIEWGRDVRDFARENSLKVSPTTGGLAAQLLRDSRFFPNPRRKVPHATNDKARPHLPGNHYELFMAEGVTHPKALYLDMRGAHHHAASNTTFPDPNRLYARGNFREPPETVPTTEPWARFGTAKCSNILRTHGLFLLRLNVPSWIQRTRKRFPPPWLRQPSGIQLAWVYSNELPFLAEYGVVLEGVEAAWTAGPDDDGLNRYARWAIDETAAMPALRKSWAKPALLAAYGMLAARPRNREFGYRHAKRGTPHVYLTSGGPIAASVLQTDKEVDSAITNVIARGMIEAAVRREVLLLADDLAARGGRVLALYADSVIIDGDSPLPLLPSHWVVKSELTALNFFNAVSFESRELVRLPGIPDRDVTDRLTNRERFRSALANRRRK